MSKEMDEFTIAEGHELGFLGGVINSGNKYEVPQMDTYALSMSPTDMLVLSHQAIWGICLDMHSKGHSVNPQTVWLAMREQGLTDSFSHSRWLELLRYPPEDTLQYSIGVKYETMRRKLYTLATDTSTGILSRKDMGELIDSLYDGLLGLAGQENVISSIVPMQEAVIEYAAMTDDLIKRRAESPDGNILIGIPTGYPSFDRVLHGWQAKLYCIAAYTGVGKSAFLGGVAVNTARQGSKVLVINMEMPPAEVAGRLIAAESEVSSNKLKTGDLAPVEIDRYTDAQGVIGSLPIFQTKVSSLSEKKLRRAITWAVQRLGIDMVIVDYMQLLGTARPQDRRVELDAIAGMLKELSLELSIPILVAAQLNRGAANQKPGLEHVRESAGIVNASDVSILIWRPHEIDPVTYTPDYTIFDIAKHRGGRKGEIDTIRFYPDQTAFREQLPLPIQSG